MPSKKMLSLALEKQKTDILFAFSKDLQAKFDSLNAELKQLKNKKRNSEKHYYFSAEQHSVPRTDG